MTSTTSIEKVLPMDFAYSPQVQELR